MFSSTHYCLCLVNSYIREKLFNVPKKSRNSIKYVDNYRHLHLLSFLCTFSLLVSNLRRKCAITQIYNIKSSSKAFEFPHKIWIEIWNTSDWLLVPEVQKDDIDIKLCVSSSPHFATTGSCNSWQSCGGDFLNNNNEILKKEMTTQRDQDVLSNRFPCCVFCI